MDGGRLLTSVLLTLSIAAPAVAAPVNAASVAADAAVTVFTPLSVTELQGLRFGTITSGKAGLVSIDVTSGARSVVGGVGSVSQTPGHYGVLVVTGQRDAAITIVVGTTISGFTSGITGVTAPGTPPTVLVNGKVQFSVGGSLSIPADTPPGGYSGVYPVTVTYP